jgi:dimethylglycine dehydrogenase
MVLPEHSAPATELEIRILGETRRATIIGDSPFDADNARLRG